MATKPSVQSQPAHAFRVRGEASDLLEIDVYDDIGESWFGEGVTAKSIRATLRENKGAKTIKLRVNSRGGDVFDGLAIYSLLLDHPARVEADVDALAASMASVILMAADEVRLAPSAMIMIHNPIAMVYGEASDMRETAAVLDKMRDQLVNAYVAKTGLDAAKIVEMMDAETWLSADEAVEHGFANSKKAAPKREDRAEALAALSLAGLHAPRGMLAAVAMAKARAPGGLLAAQGELTMDETQMVELRSLLGLADDADGAAVLDAVRALVDAATEPAEGGAETPESTAAQAQLRVLTRELDAARERLRAIDAATAERTRAEAEASVDAAIKDGRAHADCRADLVRLATSEREEDRAAYARLTSQRAPGTAPRGRVVKAEADRSGGDLTEEEQTLFRHLKAGGLSAARAEARVIARREGAV